MLHYVLHILCKGICLIDIALCGHLTALTFCGACLCLALLGHLNDMLPAVVLVRSCVYSDSSHQYQQCQTNQTRHDAIVEYQTSEFHLNAVNMESVWGFIVRLACQRGFPL